MQQSNFVMFGTPAPHRIAARSVLQITISGHASNYESKGPSILPSFVPRIEVEFVGGGERCKKGERKGPPPHNNQQDITKEEGDVKPAIHLHKMRGGRTFLPDTLVIHNFIFGFQRGEQGPSMGPILPLSSFLPSALFYTILNTRRLRDMSVNGVLFDNFVYCIA